MSASHPASICDVCGESLVVLGDPRALRAERDRYRAALEEALEWVPEPERTTIAEVLR